MYIYQYVCICTYPTDFAHIWLPSQTLCFDEDIVLLSHDYVEPITLKVIISKTFLVKARSFEYLLLTFSE